MGHVTSFIRAWRFKYSARESGCLLHMSYNAWQTMLGYVMRDRGPAWVKFWQVIWPPNSDKNSWNDDKRQQMGGKFNSDEVENKYNSKIPVGTWLPSFISQILNFIYWMVLSFYFDLLWMAWHWKPAITMWFALQCLNTIPILTIIAQENIRIKYSWTPLYWKALTSSLGKGLKLPRNSKLLNTDACRCGQQTLPFLSSQTILTEG